MRESATLFKKRLWHMYFPVNFAKFLRTPFLQNTSRRHLVLHHCVECITYAAECVSKVFIDIRMSIICGVPQKVKEEKFTNKTREKTQKWRVRKKRIHMQKKKGTMLRFPCLLTCSKQTLAYGTCITLITPTVA